MILFSLWIICIELRSAVEVLILISVIYSCIWVVSHSCCCFSHLYCCYHLSSSESLRYCDLNICFIMICIWIICCLIQFISLDCWLWLAISTVDDTGSLNVLLKHFNEDSSSDDVFLYAMKLNLCFFNEDSMSESEAVDLDFLTHFIISDDMIDNSLRFLLVKSFWNLVVWWLI